MYELKENTMDYLKNIKVMSSFNQMIRALQVITNIMRVVAVVFLILQTILLVTREKAEY